MHPSPGCKGEFVYLSQEMQIAGLILLAVALVAVAAKVVSHVRNNPEKRERERRRVLFERGRLGEALVTEVDGALIQYQYSLQGVQYIASQDCSSFTEHLPPGFARMIGTVGMKYAVKNPANSIVICEQWSGLRTMPEVSTKDDSLSVT